MSIAGSYCGAGRTAVADQGRRPQATVCRGWDPAPPPEPRSSLASCQHPGPLARVRDSLARVDVSSRLRFWPSTYSTHSFVPWPPALPARLVFCFFVSARASPLAPHGHTKACSCALLLRTVLHPARRQQRRRHEQVGAERALRRRIRGAAAAARSAYTSCVYELGLEPCVLYARERRRGRLRSRASERASESERESGCGVG